MDDVVPSIYMNVRQKLTTAQGHTKATEWAETAKSLLQDMRSNKPGTGSEGQPDPAARRRAYGQFLDLCAPHVIEDPEAVHPRDESDPCPVCGGNRLMQGNLAKYEYGGCECDAQLPVTRNQLLEELAKSSDGSLPADRIVEIADRCASQAFLSGRAVGHNDGFATALEGQQ